MSIYYTWGIQASVDVCVCKRVSVFAVAFHTADSKGVNDGTAWSGIAGDLSPVFFSNFDNNT